MTRIDDLADDDLVRAARAAGANGAAPFLDALFRRYQARVAAWCVRISGRREEAADLAQEVFLRVQERLDGFRFESSFSTWLYLVARSVTINRGIAARRRQTLSLDDEGFAEPAAAEEPADDRLARAQLAERLRAAIVGELEPLEAKVLQLHYVDGLTLPGIDRLLALTNRSGSKAYIVSAKRKLRRRFEGEAR
jgi:RNA polymerase sigma-70 factor (ECF subfamily)